MNPKLIEKILTALVKYPSDESKNVADELLGFHDFSSPLLWWIFAAIVEGYPQSPKKAEFLRWIAPRFKIADDIGRQLQNARIKRLADRI